jgi:hypothetical protein
MNYASTFLSHSHADKTLVELVARELGRRGVVAWLDQNELDNQFGVDLMHALPAAINAQATVTVFVSEAFNASTWCNDELKAALQAEDKDILPVFIGEPLGLVKQNEALRRRWLRPDQQHVKIKYEQIAPGAALLADAIRIAEQIAKRLYDKLSFGRQNEAVICLDQRGKGARRSALPEGNPPESWRAMDWPALVFRPDRGARSSTESLHGTELSGLLQAMAWTFSEAFGNLRGETKHIYVGGEAQLALPFMLGQQFDRSNNVSLFCFNSKDGVIYTNDGQDRLRPLTGGNESCEQAWLPRIQAIADGERIEHATLIIAKERYLGDALDWLEAQGLNERPVWVESPWFNDSVQAMSFVADVIALLARLRRAHGLRALRLFLDLSFGVTPLLAANLLHAAGGAVKLELMEFRRDLQGTGAAASELYSVVDLP